MARVVALLLTVLTTWLVASPVLAQPPAPAVTAEATADATPADTTPEATTQATSEPLAAASLVDQMMSQPPSIEAIWDFLLAKVPRLLLILVLAGVVLFMARLLEDRFVRLISRTGKRGSAEERENRAKTLTSVFHNAVTTFTVGFAVVAILDLFGIAASAVLGGAAVVGLAVAFGSQALIKDYFTGFILLMEQQYLINDVVTISGVTGQVEKITLRMTTLRDADGAVHFIPHGQVTIVTNNTHLWSRAVIDFSVAKEADVDAAMNELVRLAKELRNDPEFKDAILGNPTMLGVESLADGGATVRMFVKTKPLKQWPVKRELLRRINKAYAELQKPPVPYKAAKPVAPTTAAAEPEFRPAEEA